MTVAGDTAAEGAAQDALETQGRLLAVVEVGEPRGAPTKAVLAVEAGRIAGKLGTETRFVSWADQADLDIGGLAQALAVAAEAETAERTRPVAVVLADSDLSRRLAPMVATRLGSGAVIGCSDVLVRDGGLVFVKPVYGGWLEREIEVAAGTVPVVTLDLDGMPDPDPSAADQMEIDILEVEAAAASAIRSLEIVPPDPRAVDLVHAKRVVAAGMGTAEHALLDAARELADLLQGSVGATRPMVDDGLLPKERLIGQTGRTVTPELYVALGISGQPHHMAGIKKADKILSIDRDVRAPIFQFSDVGYVADLVEVLPALVEKIREYRDASGDLG